MKKLITIITILILALSTALPVYAADGKVTYSGNAGRFIFEPGSEHSLTDLFPEFKGVMPGDTLTQSITVKNNADNKVKVKIYIRALGAHEDSKEFLSQLSLKVNKSEENKMAYMFDAAADETAQLTQWVCLGTLYSGGEVNLDVTLSVATSLDNTFQNKIGYLDWEFMLEEFPIESDDPKPPPMGDNSSIDLWLTLIICALALLIILIIWRKKNTENEKDNVQQ
jgi:hypothetical protein